MGCVPLGTGMGFLGYGLDPYALMGWCTPAIITCWVISQLLSGHIFCCLHSQMTLQFLHLKIVVPTIILVCLKRIYHFFDKNVHS